MNSAFPLPPEGSQKKEGDATLDPMLAVDVSVLYGPQHGGKSRLLLQLAYRLASDARSGSSLAAGDPFQPVLLFLPRRRNLEAIPPTGPGSRAKPIVCLFGAETLSIDVLKRIHIKWYTDLAQLQSLLCELHMHASAVRSNASGVPPRFVGVLFDHALSSEAAVAATMLARLTEAAISINTYSEQQGGFAKCQCLFVMSHAPNVGRLKTLLPRYARCVFEVTPVPGSTEWLLHTRPIVAPSLLSLPMLSRLLTPMVQLQSSEKLDKLPPIPISLARFAGMPVLRYAIREGALEVTGIYS